MNEAVREFCGKTVGLLLENGCDFVSFKVVPESRQVDYRPGDIIEVEAGRGGSRVGQAITAVCIEDANIDMAEKVADTLTDGLTSWDKRPAPDPDTPLMRLSEYDPIKEAFRRWRQRLC